MPSLKRRSVLQALAAIGLAPALPKAVVAAPAAQATHAQMLWASLHAQAGSSAQFTHMAQGLGIPAKAAAGVRARLGYGVLLRGARFARFNRVAKAIRTPSKVDPCKPADCFKRWLFEEPSDAPSQKPADERSSVNRAE